MENIKSRLKELRKEKELSQKQVADAIGYKQYSIADWENGRTEPDIATIIALARFFDVSTDYLLGVVD